MSKLHIEKITCPNCKKVSDFRVWESINTTLNPDMKEKVRTGEAFSFVCPHCGKKTNVNYPTLYHQMEDQIMIYFVHGDQSKAIEALQKHSGFRFEADYRKRVVGTMNAFREKLMIFDAGLDDRVIELMKLFVVSQIHEQDPNVRIQECYFTYDPEGNNTFTVRVQDGRWGGIDFDQATYKAIAEAFKQKLEKTTDDVVIDTKWALGLSK